MEELRYSSPSSALRLLGRYYVDSEKDAMMFSFSASGFEVAFEGSSLSAVLIASECHRPQGEAAIAVVVDDQPFAQARKITLSEPDHLYVLADHLPLGKHRVRVYKRTESACSLTGWRYLKTDGLFIPLREKKRLAIEYYGDSITAGNGVEGILGDNDFETRTENAVLSYAALAAEELDADFSIVAIGGYALYKSPWNTNAPIKNIPQMFSLADCTWSTTPENAIPWDHHHFIPDVVVINLGTNDDEFLLPLPKDQQEKECQAFEEETRHFIQRIHQTYPRAQIVLCIGMIKVSLVSPILERIAASLAPRVHFLAFDSLKVGGFMPNGGHPNRAMHEEAGKELAAFIRSFLK